MHHHTWHSLRTCCHHHCRVFEIVRTTMHIWGSKRCTLKDVRRWFLHSSLYYQRHYYSAYSEAKFFLIFFYVPLNITTKSPAWIFMTFQHKNSKVSNFSLGIWERVKNGKGQQVQILSLNALESEKIFPFHFAEYWLEQKESLKWKKSSVHERK